MKFLIAALLLLSVQCVLIKGRMQGTCDSLIYCQGKLLHTVQMAKVHSDSKAFVDMKVRRSVNSTLRNFDKLMQETGDEPSDIDIKIFVYENFEYFNEFNKWTPPDFVPNPRIIDRISIPIYREFARQLVHMWPTLARRVKREVARNPDLYSVISVPNGFIVPGGRFREFYYWDSFWIVRGLLICEMRDTVKGMLGNFLHLVEEHGFVPNGARVYYLDRSQPPMLALMVDEYVRATGDVQFLRDNVHLVGRELQFWLEERTAAVRTRAGERHVLAHFSSGSDAPRPESYPEDVAAAAAFRDDVDKRRLYRNIRAAAETGWDFSSRWVFDERGGRSANISFSEATRVAPVDLNAILCKSFRVMGDFYTALGDLGSATLWYGRSRNWTAAIGAVLYDEGDGIWYDFDMEKGRPRKYYYASNLAPLWTESYHPRDALVLGAKAAAYLTRSGLMEYYGGIPVSLHQSGEQWDYPAAWAPYVSMIVFGLDKTGEPSAQAAAKMFAKRWVRANLVGFEESGAMFEKYDALQPGKQGGGGEYKVQKGFGWTNGVIFELMEHFFSIL